jgi:4-methylaminobutanoate oxidase (formaldehyde-forming)
LLAIRVTYVGELGYELYVPSDQAASVWATLEAAGSDLGLRPIGLGALHSLRLEKGYRDYGVDIDVTDTPVSAGLAFAVAWDKPTAFRGKEALAQLRDDRTSRLVNAILDDPRPLLHGGEPVLKDGQWVGYLQVGGFGHSLDRSVGLATIGHPDGITAEWLAGGGFEIVVEGVPYAARLQQRALFDPERTRILS